MVLAGGRRAPAQDQDEKAKHRVERRMAHTKHQSSIKQATQKKKAANATALLARIRSACPFPFSPFVAFVPYGSPVHPPFSPLSKDLSISNPPKFRKSRKQKGTRISYQTMILHTSSFVLFTSPSSCHRPPLLHISTTVVVVVTLARHPLPLHFSDVPTDPRSSSSLGLLEM